MELVDEFSSQGDRSTLDPLYKTETEDEENTEEEKVEEKKKVKGKGKGKGKNTEKSKVKKKSKKAPRSEEDHMSKAEEEDVMDTKEEAAQFIFDETGLRFQLAKDAPLSKTLLINDLGYLANTDTASQIINGTFPIPDEVDDITTIILEEIGRIGGLTQSGGIDYTVSLDDFRYFW